MKETTKKVLSAIFEEFNDEDFNELKTIVDLFAKKEMQSKPTKIDITKEQIVEITPEMKQKYPSLKNITKLLFLEKK